MKLHSSSQLIRLILIYIVSAPFSFILQPLFKTAQYEGGLSLLFSYTLSIIPCFFVVSLARLHPDQEFIEYGNKILSKPVHSVLLLIILLYCIYIASLDLFDYINFFGYVYLQNTSQILLAAMMMFTACVVAYSGLTAIIYMSDGFFLLVFTSIIVTTVALYPNLDYNISISLVTHHDIGNIFKGTLFGAPWFGEIFLVLFIFGSFKTGDKTTRRLLLANFYVCLILLLYWIICLFMFGPHLAKHLKYPLLDMVRFVAVGNFLENLDPIILTIWSTTLFVKLSLLIHISSKIASRLFNFKNHKEATFLIGGILVCFFAQYVSHISEYKAYSSSPRISAMYLCIQNIPLIYLIVYYIRQKISRKNKAAIQKSPQNQ